MNECMYIDLGSQVQRLEQERHELMESKSDVEAEAVDSRKVPSHGTPVPAPSP
jgi:hypothetical protein